MSIKIDVETLLKMGLRKGPEVYYYRQLLDFLCMLSVFNQEVYADERNGKITITFEKDRSLS